MYNLAVTSKVWIQLQSMIDFYEKKNSGLGNRFLKDFDETLLKLTDNPHSYFNVNKHKRRISFKVFKCMLIYKITETTVQVQVLKDFRSKPQKDFY